MRSKRPLRTKGLEGQNIEIWNPWSKNTQILIQPITYWNFPYIWNISPLKFLKLKVDLWTSIHHKNQQNIKLTSRCKVWWITFLSNSKWSVMTFGSNNHFLQILSLGRLDDAKNTKRTPICPDPAQCAVTFLFGFATNTLRWLLNYCDYIW